MSVRRQFKSRRLLKEYFGEEYSNIKRFRDNPDLLMEIYDALETGNKDYIFEAISDYPDIDLKDVIFSSPSFEEQKKLLSKEVDLRTNKRVVTIGTYTCKAPRCRKQRVETWFSQARRADELQTQHFRCATCGFYWKN